MKSSPKISVIMAVFRPDRALFPLAVNSILAQSFRDFEFIIVDDGNSIEDRKFLSECCLDERITIVRNENNLGLTKSLNVAISLAKGDLVARQDADDFSEPNRFLEQVRFLESNPGVGLLGTDYCLSYKHGKKIYTPSAGNIEIQMMYTNPFCHASVMLGKDLLQEIGGYDEKYKRSQDFELWLRLLDRTEAAILPKVLVIRNEIEGISLSTTKASYSQFANGVILRLKFIRSRNAFWLAPYFLIGTAYHLFRVIFRTLSVK
jgi:glycosyltransferase involved in cell wall biosynthesis